MSDIETIRRTASRLGIPIPAGATVAEAERLLLQVTRGTPPQGTHVVLSDTTGQPVDVRAAPAHVEPGVPPPASGIVEADARSSAPDPSTSPTPS